eukprot:CAMPEP_0176418120 /NCGR_PEP_ID=MMETSP0127-20121128/7279_1 /TAXON_ID=938130 /ORGANISM="Platyophrya macrostoma, Strain WH" /LENGTH=520 /DNA_ID=CAMNT_0017798379 /DNA_START=65 /DNA_END=1628 /DNA_ORIENTATION=-
MEDSTLHSGAEEGIGRPDLVAATGKYPAWPPNDAFHNDAVGTEHAPSSPNLQFTSYNPSERTYRDINWQSDSITILSVCMYDSTVEIPQDIYARLLGRPSKRGEVYHLVKVRSVFGGRPSMPTGAGSWSWEWDSSLWTPQAADHLGRDDTTEDTTPGTSVAWWMTIEELCASFNTLVVVEGSAVMPTWSSFASLTVPDDTPASLAHISPQFGVRVTKQHKADGAGVDQKEATATVPVTKTTVSETANAAAALSTFASLHDVIHRIPPLPMLAAEDETEDDEDGAASLVANGGDGGDVACVLKAAVLSDVFRNKGAATLEVRVSVPLSQLDAFQFQLHLYRVSSSGGPSGDGGASEDDIPSPLIASDQTTDSISFRRVACCSSLMNGALLWELPLHGRVPWHSLTDAAPANQPLPSEQKSLAFPSADAYSADGDLVLQQPTNPLDACADSIQPAFVGSYFGEVELSEGAYAMVVVPQYRHASGGQGTRSAQLLMLVSARCTAPAADASVGTAAHQFDFESL